MCRDKLSRKERTKLRHREEILQAAWQLFSEKGYRNTTVHDIAEKAEFAVGTFYNFFKNKEHLFNSLAMNYTVKYYDAVTKAIDIDGDIIGRIRNYLQVKGDFFKEDLALIRLFFSETWGISFNLASDVYSEMETLQKRFIGRLTEVFEKGIKDNIFRDVDPRFLALSIEGQSNIFLFYWFKYSEEYEYSENVPSIMDVFLNSILIAKGC